MTCFIMLIYLLFVPIAFDRCFPVFHASGRGKKRPRCKVIVGHGFKETIYTLNICINYLLWKDILKPKVTADKGYGWTGV